MSVLQLNIIKYVEKLVGYYFDKCIFVVKVEMICADSFSHKSFIVK